jgi:hypothetical protein
VHFTLAVMRNISLPVLYRATQYPADSHLDEAFELRQRTGRIISAALAIEELIIQILSQTILKEVRNHKELVVGSILKSDWCSFAAKRKLLSLVIGQFRLLSGKPKAELEKLLSQVTKYRNAFAHGSLVHNINIHELHYFEGASCKVRLDDEYFAELERVFQATWTCLQDLQAALPE